MFGKPSPQEAKEVAERIVVVIDDVRENWDMFDNYNSNKLEYGEDVDTAILGQLMYQMVSKRGLGKARVYLSAYGDMLEYSQAQKQDMLTKAEYLAKAIATSTQSEVLHAKNMADYLMPIVSITVKLLGLDDGAEGLVFSIVSNFDMFMEEIKHKKY